MPDIDTMIMASRVIWVQRFFNNNMSPWKSVFRNYLELYGGELLFYCNFSTKHFQNNIPRFYIEVLSALGKY